MAPPASAAEARRGKALEQFHLLRPFLQEGVPLTHIATASGVSLRTLRRWVDRYRVQGLSGLMRKARTDQGQRPGATHEISHANLG